MSKGIYDIALRSKHLGDGAKGGMHLKQVMLLLARMHQDLVKPTIKSLLWSFDKEVVKHGRPLG
jgi:hypothetical protein